MIPSSRPKLSDLYTLSQSKLLENHTIHSGTYYIAHIWQYPHPPGVLVHDGYCLAILVRFFHQGCACEGFFISYFAFTRNGGTTDDLGRRFGCYQQDHSNLLRRLATSRPHKFFRQRRASFLSCEAAKRATKSREVALSSLTGCYLRFAPNMGRSITRIGVSGCIFESTRPQWRNVLILLRQKQWNACVSPT